MASQLPSQIHSGGGAVFIGDGNAGRDIININHITAVKPLAQSLHRSMRNSSNQFEPLQRDLAVLMSDLDIVIEEGPKYNINCDNEPALCNISQNLQEILNDLQKLKLHYDSVGAQTQMTWDREQWRADELSEIKARLDTATSSLNTVYNKLILSSNRMISEMLELFVNEIRTGKRERSVISSHNASSLSTDENETWQELRRELETVGITPVLFSQHRELIITRLLNAMGDGDLAEDIEEELPQTPQTIHSINVAPQPRDEVSAQGFLGRGADVESKNNFRPKPQSGPVSIIPLRLLGCVDETFFVFEARSQIVESFDIVSYLWGDMASPYNCGISGVEWDVRIPPQKIEDIKRLMITSGVRYMWVDCLCLNPTDERERSTEIEKMFEYFRNARVCHILVDMPEVWYPQDIEDDLKFIDQVIFRMSGTTLASETRLSENFSNRLSSWANQDWTFELDKATARSAAIDMGLLNCYSTCMRHVRSLFSNPYFSRVWTFQELLLGKNVTFWGINPESISHIGELHVWMDLAIDMKDKAYKLHAWIESCKLVKTGSVNAILWIIEEDKQSLTSLQTQVNGISRARADIINGGPNWWHDNHKGISNVFSAVSIMPRMCAHKEDIFRGLLGIFSGLFTLEELQREMTGGDIDSVSLAFFRQLSIKTGRAWTKLALSSRERATFGWIPTIHSRLLTTDYFAGVINLGRLKQNGLVETTAVTGISGSPQKYMKILLREENADFQFVFKGCNCGRELRNSVFNGDPISTNDRPVNVSRDSTGRALVQCATILGSLMDPGSDVVEYRKRLLQKLQPYWDVSDFNAKSTDWLDECVSGSTWENPKLRTHNMSMNYRMADVTSCGSRLYNEGTSRITCEVRVNCGCIIFAPFSFIFEAITAIEGSDLGNVSTSIDEQGRIVLTDGLGLVQVEDIDTAFDLVAFRGDVGSYKVHAQNCRSTRGDKPVNSQLMWPRGRALVRERFSHARKDVMRDYGYIETGGAGNLLIYRNNLVNAYEIIGVCVDEWIANRKGRGTVTMR